MEKAGLLIPAVLPAWLGALRIRNLQYVSFKHFLGAGISLPEGCGIRPDEWKKGYSLMMVDWFSIFVSGDKQLIFLLRGSYGQDAHRLEGVNPS